MKKGIKNFLFYSVFIHLLIISVLLITLFELGHLSFNHKDNGNLTHVSVYKNADNPGNKIDNSNKTQPSNSQQAAHQEKRAEKPVIKASKKPDNKNRYKTVKNSSNISNKEDKLNNKLLQKQSGDKIIKENVKGGNENKSEAPVIISAKPEYGTNPKPEYPMVARRRGYEGEVVFNVLVLNNGDVGKMEMLKTSGHSVLDNSAQAALKKWKFIPGKSNGKFVPSWVKVPIEFRLSDI